MNRRLLFTTLVIVIFISILVYLKLQPDKNAIKTSGTTNAAPVIVKGYIVRPEVLDDRVLTSGSILSNEEVNLTSEASGKVVKISFTEGGHVVKGQLLAQLNDQELTAQLQKAQSQRDLYKAQEYRQKVLLEKQAVSQQEYDVVNSQLRAVESDIELIKAQLLKTQIVAPFNGTIGLRRVSEGSYVSPGTLISTLQNIDQVKIEFSVPEKYAAKVHAGEMITFRIRSSDKPFEARIYAVEPRIDPSTRNITMRALSPNPNGQFVPGAFADVELILDRIPNAIMIPTEGLIPELNGLRVLLKKNNVVVSQVVQTGTRTKDKIQVIEGLSVGDTVLTTGILQLKPGVPVKVETLYNDPKPALPK